MITSPKVIATPTWPSWCVLASTITAPQPAKTSANVPIVSATSARRSARLIRLAARRRRRGFDYRQTLPLGSVRLDRLHDCAVHAVGYLVGEFDRDFIEPSCLQPGDILASRQRPGDAADVGAALP